MPPPGLLDLPTEILVHIFEGLQDDSLYYLATLSRRLHFIVLPIYFSRSQVDLEAKSAVCTVGTERWGVLSALQICLFISSFEDIRCSVPHLSVDPSIIRFLDDLKRLEKFFSRLLSVKKVSLHLASWQSHWSISIRNGEELRAWSSHVGDLLNCIVERGCTSLTIIDGSSIEPDRPSLLNRMVRRIAPRASNQMPSSMPVFPSCTTHLAALIIDSASFMVSPGIEWVLAALRQAPITSLGLGFPRCDARTWGAVLPHIAAAAPGLTLLVLTDIDDAVEPIVLSILPHFVRLRDLHISYLHPLPVSLPPHSPARPRPALRHLKALRAPPVLAEHFLSSDGAVPELLVLCLLWRAPPRLNLEPLLDLLASIADKLRTRSRSPRLTLSIDARAGFTQANVAVSAHLVDKGHIAAGCARVERLHLDLDGAGKAPDALSIARLVKFFPNAVNVSLKAARGIAESFLKRLVQNLPATESLKKVELNGKTYRLRV